MPEADATANLKEVHRVWGLAEAEVIKGLLESNGIECIFQGRNVQTVYPISTDGLGEIWIMVKYRYYDPAMALL
jgi:hypothetical protein